jgi:hypothetical protein
MTAQPPLASSKPPHSVDRARQQIERLVHERLAGRKIDGISFVEELLDIASEMGEVRCSPAADHGLRFELCGSAPFEVGLDGNRGKLRMLCARLAVLCQESGQEFMPYGGEGTIRRTRKADLTDGASEHIPNAGTWQVRWANTPGQHEFTIQSAVRESDKCPQ